PILHLEGDVMELGSFGYDEIDGVIIGLAAQKRERLVAPVRYPKAENVGVELHHLLHVADSVGHMAELERHDAELAQVLLGEDIFGENLDPGILRILEDDGLGDPRRNAAPPAGSGSRASPARGQPPQDRFPAQPGRRAAIARWVSRARARPPPALACSRERRAWRRARPGLARRRRYSRQPADRDRAWS